MTWTITRTYEADVDFFGFGVDQEEFHFNSGQIWIGLGTNTSDINNIPSGTKLVLTQAEVSAIIRIDSRRTLLSEIAIYSFTLLSGSVGFADGIQTTIQTLQPVTVHITFDRTSLYGGQTATATLKFSETVDDFGDGDASLNVGTLGSVSGSGTTYTVPITAPADDTSGNIELTVRQNAVLQGNDETSASIPYSPLPTPPTWLTGSALESSVDALDSATIDIASKVTNATSIKALGGLQEWLSFDGTHLVIEQAPILRRDTEFRVKLRAKNEDLFSDAFHTLTVNASKLAMLQSTLFFKPSIAYDGDRVTQHGTSIIVREMTDNNYETFSSENDVEINTADADGNHPTTIQFIALKTKNVDRFSFFPSGGTGTGFSNRAMPTHFVATDGEAIPTVVNGYQHELYPLPSPVTATSVRMQFHGTDIEIYTVMLLELIVEIRDGDFLDILPDKVDRTGEILDFLDGGVDRGQVIGAERWKWETQYVLEVLPEGTTFDAVPKVRKFISDNPHIVHAQEPARYPDRIYHAIQAKTEISEELQGKYKGSGHIVPFTVSER